MTRVSLLSIKVDSTPEQVQLDPEYGLTLRLDVGVSLDLTDASEETCRAMARLLLNAAQIKSIQRLPEVV